MGMSVVQFSSVQSLSCVRLFVTPWIAALQASLSITNSQNPPKPMSIESVMPSNHLILSCPLLLLPSIFPRSGSFPMSQLFASDGQSIGVSASTSVLPMNTQDWSPLGWTAVLPFKEDKQHCHEEHLVKIKAPEEGYLPWASFLSLLAPTHSSSAFQLLE